jgi:hypothetical protein
MPIRIPPTIAIVSAVPTSSTVGQNASPMTSTTGLRWTNESPRSSVARLTRLVTNWFASRLSGRVERSISKVPRSVRTIPGKTGWSSPRRSLRSSRCARPTLRGSMLLLLTGSPGSIRNRKKLRTAIPTIVSRAPPMRRTR